MDFTFADGSCSTVRSSLEAETTTPGGHTHTRELLLIYTTLKWERKPELLGRCSFLSLSLCFLGVVARRTH